MTYHEDNKVTDPKVNTATYPEVDKVTFQQSNLNKVTWGQMHVKVPMKSLCAKREG